MLGHDIFTVHAASFADIQRKRPVTGGLKLVFGKPELGYRLAGAFGHAGIVLEEVHQALLVVEMGVKNLLAPFV